MQEDAVLCREAPLLICRSAFSDHDSQLSFAKPTSPFVKLFCSDCDFQAREKEISISKPFSGSVVALRRRRADLKGNALRVYTI